MQSSRIQDAVDIVVTGNLFAGLENRRRRSSTRPRVLLPKPRRASRRWSARRLNALLRGLPNARRYLEIGVERGYTFEAIDVETRWGVDPAPQFDLSSLPSNAKFFVTTSDEFFEHRTDGAQFDVVFLDGLHRFEQTHRDLLNALSHIRSGAVLIDDTVPCDEASASPDRHESLARRSGLGSTAGLWHGDVWKVVVCISRHHPELAFRTIIGGSDNPQTLVWRKGGGELSLPSDEAMSAIAALSYGSVFSDGLPALFQPRGEADALRECLEVLAPRRTSSASP